MDAIERAVRQRMKQERRALERDLRQLDRNRLAKSAGEQRALDRLDTLVDTIRDLDAEGKPIRDALTERVTEDAHEVERALKAVIRVANERADVLRDLKRLDTQAEFKRRLREARRLAELSDGNVRGTEAAELILLQAGAPLHYKEITRRALEAGLIKTKAAEPKQTISGYLVRGLEGEEPRFVRVGPGRFDLAERHEGAAA